MKNESVSVRSHSDEVGCYERVFSFRFFTRSHTIAWLTFTKLMFTEKYKVCFIRFVTCFRLKTFIRICCVLTNIAFVFCIAFINILFDLACLSYGLLSIYTDTKYIC